MKRLLYILLGGAILAWLFKKGLRGIRDIALLCIVIAYSGAHWPTSHGMNRIADSFKAGYARGVIEHDERERQQNNN